MSRNWPKAPARAVFRWYLNKFPLRDGKAYLYQLWHGKLAPEERYLIATLDRGFKMRLDLKDEEQLKIYFYGHYHERYEARLIELLLDPEEAFWDVGANIGYFSLVAATALKGRGQVAAFEPGGAAFHRLSENVSLNRFSNIRIYNLAVSDREGEAVLYVSGDIADSSANLYGPGGAQARPEVCRTVTLDKFREDEGLPFPAFIKVDVEGAELAVLKGAQDLIAQHPPLLLLEMEEKNLRAAGASREAIQKLLKRWGYQAAFLRKGRWQATAEVEGVTGRNIFWFNPDLAGHREKAARLPIYRQGGSGAGESRLSL
jgi:FkbM family methyltransferase